MKQISRRQKDTLDFIRGFISLKGYSPTLDEIAEGIDIFAKSVVHEHLKKLKEKGFIDFQPGKPRTIKIIELEEAINGNHA